MNPKSLQTLRETVTGKVLKLARHGSETIGTDFLSMLAHKLAGVSEAKCVYVGEFVGGKNNRVRTLATFSEDARPGGFEFLLAGSPNAEVARAVVFAKHCGR
jgi:hypothetical protein